MNIYYSHNCYQCMNSDRYTHGYFQDKCMFLEKL